MAATQISWEIFTWVVGGLVSLIIANWVYTWSSDKNIVSTLENDNQLLHSRISSAGLKIDDNRLEAARGDAEIRFEMRKALDQHKLDVAKEYASVVHLKDVENRLIAEIKGLREDIRELTKAMSEKG